MSNNAPTRPNSGKHSQPYYTPPADTGPVCMHSGELVRSHTYGAVAVRPRVIAAETSTQQRRPAGV